MDYSYLVWAIAGLCVFVHARGVFAWRKASVTRPERRDVVNAALRRYSLLWSLWCVGTAIVVVERSRLQWCPPSWLPSEVREALWVYTLGVTSLLLAAVWSDTGVVLKAAAPDEGRWQAALRERQWYRSRPLLATALCLLPALAVWLVVLICASGMR
jgi:hypothetical protein